LVKKGLVIRPLREFRRIDFRLQGSLTLPEANAYICVTYRHSWTSLPLAERLQKMDRPKGKALAWVSDQSTHLDWCNRGHTKSPPNLQEMKVAFVFVGS
tara:strand:+ start:110 stop:406 length:297 start_codon:yes stop_codon:yes gene_type:complete